VRVLILLVAVAGFVSIAYNRARQSIASFKAGGKYDGVRLGPAMYADPTDHPIVIAIGWGLRELIWWWLVTILIAYAFVMLRQSEIGRRVMMSAPMQRAVARTTATRSVLHA
jgi:hypothetical protein